jgi:phosphoribosylformylglycinamidine synthase
MCNARKVPWTRIGVAVTDMIDVQDAFTVGLEELREAFEGTLPALFA